MTTPSFVAIDPGYARKGGGCAVARFVFGTLRGAWFERPHDFRDSNVGADDFVIWERPQYEGGTHGRSTKISPEVLIALTEAGASLAGLYAGAAGCPIIAKTPRQWKGSLQKPPHHAALWAVLSEAERALLGGAKTGAIIDRACERGALDCWRKHGVEYYPSGFVTHNLLDAVALGCGHIGRLHI